MAARAWAILIQTEGQKRISNELKFIRIKDQIMN
jgi:hypothetical protein